MNGIVIKVEQVHMVLTEEEARSFLASFEAAIYDWRVKSEQAERETPVKLLCSAWSQEGMRCTVEKTV